MAEGVRLANFSPGADPLRRAGPWVQVGLVFFDLMIIRIIFVNAEASIRWLEDAAHRAHIQTDPVLFDAAHGKLRLLRAPKYLIGAWRRGIGPPACPPPPAPLPPSGS